MATRSWPKASRILSTLAIHTVHNHARQDAAFPVRMVVLDFYGVHDIYASAIKMLKSLFTDLKAGKGKWVAAIEVVVSGTKGNVRDMLVRGGVVAKVSQAASFEAALGRGPSAAASPRNQAEWAEAMHGAAEQHHSSELCRQFVQLRTAVRYAVWRAGQVQNQGS